MSIESIGNCHICNAKTEVLFRAPVLGKYDAPFHYCSACDHVFVPDPHWLAEAYSDAIVAMDTDIVRRNVVTSLRLSAFLSIGLDERGHGNYVDVAGGYGLLTRLMRDFGFNYYWSDPYAANLFARGFEYNAAIGKCNAVSAVEVLEHTTDPLQFLQRCVTEFQTDTIAFTTEVFPSGKPPRDKDWYYYVPETGQHIAFFSHQGLERLGKRLDMRYIRLGRVHLFTRRSLSTFKLKLATNNAMVLPAAYLAQERLGTKRGLDQQVLTQAARVAQAAQAAQAARTAQAARAGQVLS